MNSFPYDWVILEILVINHHGHMRFIKDYTVKWKCEYEVSAKNSGGMIQEKIGITCLLFKEEVRELHVSKPLKNWALKPRG